MRPAFDPTLYLVTDRGLCNGRDLELVVAQAVQGGVSLVQLREKRLGIRDLIDLGRALKALLTPLGIPLIVNDRVDAAQAIGAAGVHLGQSDMPVDLARCMLGNDALIGLSLEDLEQLSEAERHDVDYYGVSPVFPTNTKTDTAPAWGLDGLRRLRGLTARPLVAIGGINAGNAASVRQAGADGLAVVSAICAADDPAAAARELRERMR